MELSGKIKAVRESKKIKLNQVAETLGIDVSNYAKIERKGNKISFERLEDIAQVLGVKVQDILNWGEGENKPEVVSSDNTNLQATLDLLNLKVLSLEKTLTELRYADKGRMTAFMRLADDLEGILWDVAEKLGQNTLLSEEEEEDYYKKKPEGDICETILLGRLYTFEDLGKIVLYLEKNEPKLCIILATLFETGILNGENLFAYIFMSRRHNQRLTIPNIKKKWLKLMV